MRQFTTSGFRAPRARRMLAASAVLTLFALPSAFGYIGETITTGTPPQSVQVTRADAASLQFYLNSQVVAGATSSLAGTQSPVITAGSTPAAAVETAMATWNNIGASNIVFNPLLPTTVGHDSSDCQNVITFAGSAADLSILGFVSASSPGVVAVTANAIIQSAGAVCGGTTTLSAGTIVDSDILLNPYFAFSTNGTANTKDVQAILTHEFGHVLGMNHSGLVGATMYPYSFQYQRHVSWDEKAFAATYYPSGKKTLGTISGTVTLGSNPAVYALVSAIDISGGQKTVGGLTASDGTFSIPVPAGTYEVYAEPLNSFIGAANIYSLTSSTGVISSSLATTAFQATLAGGNSSPTQLAVTAGASATANISVTAGATPLAPPYWGIGRAGANGDISTFNSFAGAIPVTAGSAVDLAFAGTGIDKNMQLYFIGTNISLGTPRVDTLSNVGGNPIVRTTLTMGSQTNATMGTLWIVEGTNVLPLTGILDVEPMVPTVSSVLDAESARPSITSGQWAAIYGLNLANTTRAWSATADFTGGVATGDPLPSNLDGIQVTVNSVPASVYFVCATCSPNQVNFLTPSNLSTGNANVVVTNQGTSSAAFTATVVQASPSFFYYAAGGSLYPLAVHLTAPYNYVGDPAVSGSNYEKAHPGETIAMFANGLAPATGGIIVPVTAFPQAVTISAGSTALTTSAPYLVSAGEFQVNVTLPSTIATGTYVLSMSVPGGSTSNSGVSIILPVAPAGQ